MHAHCTFVHGSRLRLLGIVCLGCGLLMTAGKALADAQIIGAIPTNGGYIDGIGFDDVTPGDPIVPLGTSGEMTYRLNPSDASVLQTYTLPGGNTTRGMEYIGDGNFYQTRNQPSALFVVNPFNSTATAVGTSLGGVLYNTLGIGLDHTTGTLWMATDYNGNSLYQINRTTGAATAVGTISGVHQIMSMAVGPTGSIYISDSSGSVSVDDSIWQVDPDTLQVTKIMSVGYAAPDYLTDFSYDPYSNQWYGVLSQQTEYDLVKLPGMPVPEPAALGVAGIGWLLAGRRHQRKTGN